MGRVRGINMPANPQKNKKLPASREMLHPIVQALLSGQSRHRDALLTVAKQFGYSEDDVKETLPAGSNQTFAMKFEHAAQHLVKCELVRRPAKGQLALNDAGIRAAGQSANFGEGGPYGNIVEPKLRKRKDSSWKQMQVAPSRLGRSGGVSADKTIKNLSEMPMHRLAALWKNAVKIQADASKSKWHSEASRLLKAIDKEWTTRGQQSDPSEWFRWPNTDGQKGDGTLQLSKALGEGMFAYLEYHVGRTRGEASPVRQSILSRIFEATLPPVFERAYMDEWGKNKSAHRLKKMAETIAALTRNAKRRGDDRLEEAIRQWEADLEFLYDRYYVGHFGFAWPDTRI